MKLCLRGAKKLKFVKISHEAAKEKPEYSSFIPMLYNVAKGFGDNIIKDFYDVLVQHGYDIVDF